MKKTTEPRRSFRERIGIKKKVPEVVVPEPTPLENFLLLIHPDSWLWDYATPVANSLGVTSSGVAAGSLVAKAAALASSASSASAIAPALVTPVGLCLVTTVVVVGGSVLIGRALFGSSISDDAWIVIEANDIKKTKDNEKGDQYAVAVFDDEKTARKAFKHSRLKSKALFGPKKTLVESRKWQDQFRRVVTAM